MYIFYFLTFFTTFLLFFFFCTFLYVTVYTVTAHGFAVTYNFEVLIFLTLNYT